MTNYLESVRESRRLMVTGDSLLLLRSLPDASIDAVVTDPPYGISFGGSKWDYDLPDIAFWIESLRVLKPGGYLLAFGSAKTYHRLAVAIEDSGFDLREKIVWLYASGHPKSMDIGRVLRKRDGDDSEIAAIWEGWETTLKPAHEEIGVFRKPMPGTLLENVMGYGTGALNIDAARIGGVPKQWERSRGFGFHQSVDEGESRSIDNLSGRYPPNVCFSHSIFCTALVCVDSCPVRLLGEQSGIRPSGSSVSGNEPSDPIKNIYNPFQRIAFEAYEDSVTAARYFPIFWPEPVDAPDGDPFLPFLYIAKPSSRERDAGLRSGNAHPTIKPIGLMRWLLRLVMPPDGIFVDPFAGSGTTLCAGAIEDIMGIGGERDPDFSDIARARIAYWTRRSPSILFDTPSPSSSENKHIMTDEQLDLFGDTTEIIKSRSPFDVEQSEAYVPYRPSARDSGDATIARSASPTCNPDSYHLLPVRIRDARIVGDYRYTLSRVWSDALPICCFVMYNPSTADAIADDNTIRRCISFARSLRCGSLEVVNLFAYRSKLPTDLFAVADPVGPENDEMIRSVATRAKYIVCGYGGMIAALRAKNPAIGDRLNHVLRLLTDRPDAKQNMLYCLGLTQDGYPKHPLYIPTNAPLLPFAPVLIPRAAGDNK